MSAADSTIKEKALFPYWTESSAERSLRLWLPTEIVLSGLDSTSLLTSSSGTGVKSWFSTTSYQAPKKSLPATLSVSSIFSLAESTGYADTVIKSRRIRLYPDAKQKQLLREWFGCGRWVYNATLDYIRDNPGEAILCENPVLPADPAEAARRLFAQGLPYVAVSTRSRLLAPHLEAVGVAMNKASAPVLKEAAGEVLARINAQAPNYDIKAVDLEARRAELKAGAADGSLFCGLLGGPGDRK